MVDKTKLKQIARALVAPGKNIIAADEASGLLNIIFQSYSINPSLGNRKIYRELLFTTPEIERYVSGVILFDETVRQKTRRGIYFPKLLLKRGILPGVKADIGPIPLAFSPHEKITQGLDGLGKRLTEYKKLGIRFSKWRAVITIGKGIPTDYCINVNTHALARFAAISQECGLVPIVEPDVLMDSDNGIEICERTTTKTLKTLFQQLSTQRVYINGTVLKTNMVISGKKCKTQASKEQIARATIRCLIKTVPKELPGIVFLSGGQREEQATDNLNEINKVRPLPWRVCSSYRRALRHSVLKTWRGKSKNIKAAQEVLRKRVQLNSLATKGKYNGALESIDN